jgi:hypothetical protein
MKTKEETKDLMSTLKSKVGLSLDKFVEMCEKEGILVRVTERNGRSLFTTMDYRQNRINVATTAPIVSEEIIDIDGTKIVEQKVDDNKQVVTAIKNFG